MRFFFKTYPFLSLFSGVTDQEGSKYRQYLSGWFGLDAPSGAGTSSFLYLLFPLPSFHLSPFSSVLAHHCVLPPSPPYHSIVPNQAGPPPPPPVSSPLPPTPTPPPPQLHQQRPPPPLRRVGASPTSPALRGRAEELRWRDLLGWSDRFRRRSL